MYKNRKVIALIPARGGSKRLPRKNILPLCGKPLIGWTIEAARNSEYIDEIIVSTDDNEIASIAEQFGITVPNLRPTKLSTDTASTKSVIFHALEENRIDDGILILLQPTSPLRSSAQIDEVIQKLNDNSAFSVISVTPCEHPVQWMNVLPQSGSMANFLHKNDNKRSQDLEDSFRLNGAIYAYDIQRVIALGDISYSQESFAYIMSNETSIDIDNQLDFDFAEFVIARKNASEGCL
ncbi:acylneuraminate cytidylyltransferase family protein [Vibrio splendidus]|uniref:acylneuraminate cytidylyltransferase family protein n=1 Tax=Vibrio splendidus TaxID=29497 RepID=UPI000C849605|nr:acylneuraminate cytidylyltransferase family protein [Vibrio splendidus]PMO23475.1 CMP-N-acetlyneuraminic acid synthetase [Vibrio splendidus]